MNDLNSVNIIGRLVRDMEIKYTSSGKPVGDFSVANNHSVKVNNAYEDRPNFFDCVLFGKQVESISDFMIKGKMVAVNGKLKQERWKNNEGQARTTVKIIVNSLQLLGSKKDDQQPAPQPQSGKQMVKDEFTPEESDDVPF